MVAGGERIVTGRLILRRWRESDAEPMAAINADPEVTRYLNRPAPVADHGAFVERAESHWREHGFGWYAVEGTAGGERGALIGFVGIALPTFIPALAHRQELGWRLARSAWGKGYATESARAVRDDAAATLAFDELISIIDTRNVRSQRVGTKLGMTVQEQVLNPLSGRHVDVWQMPLAA